jgi:hypothetical protein
MEANKHTQTQPLEGPTEGTLVEEELSLDPPHAAWTAAIQGPFTKEAADIAVGYHQDLLEQVQEEVEVIFDYYEREGLSTETIKWAIKDYLRQV